jgi:hypothetical protein
MPYILKKYQNGGSVGDPLPPKGTISGDLLRALEGLVQDYDSENFILENNTERFKPFNQLLKDYGGVQSNRIDTARNYYNALYSNPKIRDAFMNQIKQRGKNNPDPYGPLGDWTRAWKQEEGDSHALEVLEALKHYGKSADDLAEDSKDRLLNRYRNRKKRGVWKDNMEDFENIAEYKGKNKDVKKLSRRKLKKLTKEDFNWDEDALRGIGEMGVRPYDKRENFLLSEKDRELAGKLLQIKYPEFRNLFDYDDPDRVGRRTAEENKYTDLIKNMTPEGLAELSLDLRRDVSQKIPYDLQTKKFLDEDEKGRGRVLGAYYRGVGSDKPSYIEGTGIWPAAKVQDTALEELSHAMDHGLEDQLWQTRYGGFYGGLNLSDKELESVTKNIKSSWDRWEEKTGRNARDHHGNYGDHLYNEAGYYRDPSEVVARIRILKNLSGEALPEGGYSKKHLDKIESLESKQEYNKTDSTRALSDLSGIFTEEEILDMMNNVYGKGGKFKVNKRRKMRVTKK